MALIGGANGASRSIVTQSMKMNHLNAQQHPPMRTGHSIPSNYPHMATGTLDGKVGTTTTRGICPGRILPETPAGTNFVRGNSGHDEKYAKSLDISVHVSANAASELSNVLSCARCHV